MQGPPRYFPPSESELAVRFRGQIAAMAIQKEQPAVHDTRVSHLRVSSFR
jgi:hypothetical protein